MTSFHFPVLSSHDFGLFRSPGPGLGNLMFPMARAALGAAESNGVYVSPTIRQIKFGPILRNEPDKRIYGNVFKHRNAEDWKNRFRIMGRPVLSEDAAKAVNSNDAVIHYKGLKNYFHDLQQKREQVGHFFNKRTRYDGLLADRFDIAVHIRLGDFAAPRSGDAGPNLRSPIAWYEEASELARHLLGNRELKIVVFSDAENDDVERFMRACSGVHDPSRNAMTSLVNMSKAEIIVTSRSTFSMWAAFLGNSHAIWNIEFDLQKYFPLRPTLDLML